MGSNPTPSAISVRLALIVSLVLLAACAAGIGNSAPASFGAATTPVATAKSSATIGASPTATPSLADYESQAMEHIQELTGTQCLVSGIGTIRPPDPAMYADQIAQLPNREGWLEEPFIWVGTPEGLASAMDATLIGVARSGAWLIYTDRSGNPRAESFVRFEPEPRDALWIAKDSIAAVPCSSDGNHGE